MSKNAIRQLHDLGQSLWLDNISRELISSGALNRYINNFSVTGLTSNPTIFDHAIRTTGFYDDAIRHKAPLVSSAEALFLALALEDLTAAADLFLPIYEITEGVDGWVSFEVSPLLVQDTEATILEARQIYARAKRPNLFVKIPGNLAGIAAIEEAIFAGVPVNVTLLFSSEQYIAAAEAYMRGIERRIVAGLDAKVESVASVFVSRWDVAANPKTGDALHNQFGIAVAKRIYRTYRDLLASPRWRKLSKAGAHKQRLLWASTGTKDPVAADTLYVDALVAPDTINTMPEKTLLAFAEYGTSKNLLSADGGDTDEVLLVFARAGVDYTTLAAQLQREGVAAFTQSWNDLMSCIADKSATSNMSPLDKTASNR
jgi:transaldolase